MQATRRQFLAAAAAGLAKRRASAANEVNDIHSRLNRTRVKRIALPAAETQVRALVAQCRREGSRIAIAGGRHAMGGQQFAAGEVLLDASRLNRVLAFDSQAGTVTAEAGMQWPELIGHLLRVQQGRARQWGIAQKQTGADRLSLGGALAANIHSRGLRMKPFIADVESFTLIDARGEPHICSRNQNVELFRLAAGGYGLFGAVTSLTLRLTPRQKLERVVEVIRSPDLMGAFENRIAQGYLYGDFQFAVDPASDDFLRLGVFSCYRPADPAAPVGAARELAQDDWQRLLLLAHRDKSQAFRRYAEFYLATNGQIYWSDTHQLSVYIDDYHRELDRATGAKAQGTEMITEIYVPRPELAAFLDEARSDFRRNGVDVVYGTVRLIEKDDESFLAWAREPWACTIFNLHVTHTPAGLEHAAESFRRLIEMAIRRRGSYYLTYHRWAHRRQVEACYPRFGEFLRAKQAYDPDLRFQSDWYIHYRKLFA